MFNEAVELRLQVAVTYSSHFFDSPMNKSNTMERRFAEKKTQAKRIIAVVPNWPEGVSRELSFARTFYILAQNASAVGNGLLVLLSINYKRLGRFFKTYIGQTQI